MAEETAVRLLNSTRRVICKGKRTLFTRSRGLQARLSLLVAHDKLEHELKTEAKWSNMTGSLVVTRFS